MTDFSLIIQHVRDNACTPLKVCDVANVFAISSEHLSRQFSKHAGQSFVNFRNSLRVEKAKELLAYPGTMDKIATDVGFESTVQFHRAFVRHAGMTPMKWRKTLYPNAHPLD